VVLAGQMALRAGVQRFLVVSAVNANARSPFFLCPGKRPDGKSAG
jgi:hypothetical protein